MDPEPSCTGGSRHGRHTLGEEDYVRRRAWNSVLIVEDDAATRTFYETTLKRAGYTVVVVEDGIAALRYFEHQRPGVVVLDFDMPRLAGRDVYHELKANPAMRKVPVVVMTGAESLALDSRDDRVLRKPVDEDVLLRHVDIALVRGLSPPRGLKK